MSKHEEWLALYLADGNDNLSHLFFDESKHKRDKNGRFAKKEGGLTKTSTGNEPRKLSAEEWDKEIAAKKPTLASKLMDKLEEKGIVKSTPNTPKKSIHEKLEDAGIIKTVKNTTPRKLTVEEWDKEVAAKRTPKEKISDAYNSAKKGTNAKIGKIKDSLGTLVNKVDSSAKSGKDKASSMISKGKQWMDKTFTNTTTTFNTQADKLKQKKKSLFTKTKYDTSSYKNT